MAEPLQPPLFPDPAGRTRAKRCRRDRDNPA
jgi:hypothetical protein